MRYFDAVVNDMAGAPLVIENAICLHEEDAGLLWKHWDWRTGETEIRRSRRLVISSIATVGNYEYAFYWYFYQDGTIQFEIKLTGIINTAGCVPGAPQRFGTEVAPGVLGQVHQHIFNMRLDVAIDGESNAVVEVDFHELAPGPTTRTTTRSAPRRRCSRPRRRRAAGPLRSAPATGRSSTEPEERPRPASRLSSAAARRGAAVHLRAGAGQPPRRLHPQPSLGAPRTSASPPDPTSIRAPESRASTAGPSRIATSRTPTSWSGTASPTTTCRGPEDFPVQPVVSTGFTLQPFGFFDRNPALDVPPPAPSRDALRRSGR